MEDFEIVLDETDQKLGITVNDRDVEISIYAKDRYDNFFLADGMFITKEQATELANWLLKAAK